MSSIVKQTGYGAMLLGNGKTDCVLDTELSALANNTWSAVPSTVFVDNSVGLHTEVDLHLTATFGTAPTAGSSLAVFMLPSFDGGVTYPVSVAGANLNNLGGLLLATFTMNNVTTAQEIMALRRWIPPGRFKLVAYNNGTGQTLTTAKLRMYPHGYQSV